MIKNIIIGVLAVVIVIAGISYVLPKQQDTKGTTNFDAVSLSSGLTVAGSTVFASSTTSGGINNVVNASTTVTLTQADLTGYSTINILASTTAASSIVLPASSTLTTLIPNAGDISGYTITNATTTGSVHVLTIAGGTGTTLQISSTTAALVPAKTGYLRLIRLPSTNVIAQFTPFSY